ncbi:hypothetical protein NEOLI_004675 [Neolecta irregularis DAH-3]|uniref:LysM domain-containing protein n=1 Tax=Neolecta irregularis (strain DAH-3) TaxID=1198029 RepID=A0A1U7LLE3_NEOID|nr:hypothetical protein NEOLI_004675 [Neolecta irregularis DAH-3]|eukprot:OLL23486.1 hypothetical protein NEOLI_004675 [Neolecta irregularis DAH-3]
MPRSTPPGAAAAAAAAHPLQDPLSAVFPGLSSDPVPVSVPVSLSSPVHVSLSSPVQVSLSSRTSSPVPVESSLCHPPLTPVFVHTVLKHDSLPKILLAYNIDAAHLRKANALWPSDSIFARSVLFLPVRHCNIPIHYIAHDLALVPTIGPVPIRSLPTPSFFPHRPTLFPPDATDAPPRESIDSDFSISSLGGYVQDKLMTVYRRFTGDSTEWTCTDLIEL